MEGAHQPLQVDSIFPLRPKHKTHNIDSPLQRAQEPEKAVRAFDSALELSPKDGSLLLRCAAALVTAHEYQR
jgi:hypothetical protein